MRLRIIAVGKIREREVRSLMDDYLTRIRHYAPIEELELRSGAELVKAFRADEWVVALEVLGKQLSSEAFSKSLERWGSQGKGNISFLIGGAEGIDPALSKRANFQISLSTMTLPHRLARVLLAEQIYRGFSILRGEPYAREG